MQAQKERWQQLCEQVVVEQDPIRFQQLVEELNELLLAKEKRLASPGRNDSQAGKISAP